MKAFSSRGVKVLVMLGLAALCAVLLYAISCMPGSGDSAAPDKTYAVPRYISRGLEEAGGRSVHNDILFNYRAFDTMCMILGLFVACCAVVAVMDRPLKGHSRTATEITRVPSSVMPRTVARLLVPLTALFVAYIAFLGSDAFAFSLQMGVILGGGLILLAFVFSMSESTRGLSPWTMMVLESLALVVFLLVGTVGLLAGHRFMTLTIPSFHGTAAEIWRAVLSYVLALAIAVSTAAITVSMVFSMMRKE